MTGYSVFGPADLDALETLYETAAYVRPMGDITQYGPRVIGLRHDVDNFIEPALMMARWEAERGYRSTYFILHTAPYWSRKRELHSALHELAELGHEVGFHVNALAESIRTGRDPVPIVAEALAELRSSGHAVRGVVAHGDPACYLNGRVRFVNDEMFTESPRPEYGAADRVIEGTYRKLSPVSRAMFGLEYDPNWLPRAEYLSDSGGRWSKPFHEVAGRFPYDGQLHMLVHPDWWGGAF